MHAARSLAPQHRYRGRGNSRERRRALSSSYLLHCTVRRLIFIAGMAAPAPERRPTAGLRLQASVSRCAHRLCSRENSGIADNPQEAPQSLRRTLPAPAACRRWAAVMEAALPSFCDASRVVQLLMSPPLLSLHRRGWRWWWYYWAVSRRRTANSQPAPPPQLLQQRPLLHAHHLQNRHRLASRRRHPLTACARRLASRRRH